jgi:hypothetical protein
LRFFAVADTAAGADFFADVFVLVADPTSVTDLGVAPTDILGFFDVVEL